MTTRPTGIAATLAGMAVALVAAGVMRPVTEAARRDVAPGTAAVAESTAALGRLDSAALALVLGGLRGPLVMALWADTQGRQLRGAAGTDLPGDLEAKIELIRLLQPQFDSVHLQQIFNVAYNLSAQLVTPAARYGAILDGITYARRVLEERPYNVDLETQLGQLFGNKLGSADERDYYAGRVRRETMARVPMARVTLPAEDEEAFRLAAARAGISPRELDLRTTRDPATRQAVVAASVAELIRTDLSGVTLDVVAVATPAATGVGVRRLEPMLDADGRLLASLTTPTRESPAGSRSGEYLDGSRVQFLGKYEPFPQGLSPQALAYEHAMRAYVLQEFAGQRHVQHSASFLRANPGRALRDWSIATLEEGRQIEAEALGRRPPRRSSDGREQGRTELLSADLPINGVPFPALLRRAVALYERSMQVSEPAGDWLLDHMRRYPEARGTFQGNIDRLAFNNTLLAADVAYARLALGEGDASPSDVDALYDIADVAALDFVMRYHVVTSLLPEGVTRFEVETLPRETKASIYAEMGRMRTLARGTGRFGAERVIDEFDGIRTRIATRRALLGTR